jgi:HK97 family phage prohead protease
VKRSRDLIAGSLGSLPIDLFRASDRARVTSTLLDQPERDVPRAVTMTRTVEDMLFEQTGWWRITETDWTTYPVHVEKLNPRSVTVKDKGPGVVCPQRVPGCSGRVDVDGKHVHDPELIRFDSPGDALLVAGARAIRTCLALDTAANRNATGVPPVDYLTPADPMVTPDDTEVATILADWQTARATQGTAYVPATLAYHEAGWSPDKLQLAEQRQHAVLEIARVAGIDPEELGVSTTSRTYANQFDRRKAFLDFTLGSYVSAIQDRLSMGDVNPRGYYARFNLDAFLRSDTLTRYQAYEVGKRVGAITGPEIREAEDKPPLTPEQELAAMPSQPAPTEPMRLMPAAAAAGSPARFEGDAPAVTLDAYPAATFQVDRERRTIRGLALPYDVVGRADGQQWQFPRGSLRYGQPSRVKLWVEHDKAQAVGVAFELDDRPDGLYPAFRVARGPEGDRALSLAEDGVLDGLSVGIGSGGKFARKDGVNHAIEAPLMEISLTAAPAFADARVHTVAASADTKGNTMRVTNPPASADTPPADTPTTDQPPNPGPAEFSEIHDAIRDGFEQAYARLANPQQLPPAAALPARQTVSAAGPSGFAVTREELPYRFNGTPGQFSFLDDLRDSSSGNSVATQRLEEFMGEVFAVTVSNAGALNPTENRPELWVPNLQYTRPLYEMCSTGPIDNKTPFTVPKFSAAAGLVAAHVEGTEPTPGSFSATSQTVTPSPSSGKIEINREVWDQGGSPQVDAIIWAEMLNGWFEAVEAKIATLLNGLSLTETNLASAVDGPLNQAMVGLLADLQFARGGNRYTAFAADGLMFKALVQAKDSGGRPIYPVVGPQNAPGTTSGGFDRVLIGNLEVRAAWALGSTNASNSYLFVPASVWCWTSPPRRFTFEYQIKSIDMAVWGYTGTACLRDSDVKRIDYTTADT